MCQSIEKPSTRRPRPSACVIAKESPELAREVAKNSSAPLDLLEVLSRERDPLVKEALAGNPNTPLPALLRLAVEHPARLLENPALPLLLLENPSFFEGSCRLGPSSP